MKHFSETLAQRNEKHTPNIYNPNRLFTSQVALFAGYCIATCHVKNSRPLSWNSMDLDLPNTATDEMPV
jgi:hypothetical protein